MIQKAINPYPFSFYGITSPSEGQSLALLIIDELKTNSKQTKFKSFADGSFLFYNETTERDADIYVFAQIRYGSPEERALDLVKLYYFVDALKQASANRITVIIPCMPDARQDKPSNYREPVLVHHVGKVLKSMGADRLVVMKLHNVSSLTVFPMIQMINILTDKLLVNYIESKVKSGIIDLSKTKIVAADSGGVTEARNVATRLKIPNQIVMINKYHDPAKTNHSEISNIIGDVSGYDVIIVEDMLDTCGTAKNSANELRKSGAKNIYIIATHALLNGKAINNLNEAKFDGIWVTDSCIITQEKIQNIKNLEVISVASLFAKVIDNLHNGESVIDLL